MRRDEQRLPSDPPQPGLHGQLFLAERSRIDEGAPFECGVGGLQRGEHPAEAVADRRVVIRRAGIGGDAGAAAGRVAFARAVLVGHGADHRRPGPLDQPPRVEPLVGVAFQIVQRRLIARRQPFAETGFVLGQMAARRDAAEVEPLPGGEPFDVPMVEHFDILAQK